MCRCVHLHAVCETHSEMQSMSLLGGMGHASSENLKMHALKLNLVLSEIAMLRTGSGSLL